MSTARLLRLLGAELRRERRRLKWTRRDLRRCLGWDVSLQTLATYELGTRPVSVPRFVELCAALGVSAVELLARVIQPASGERLRLNLHAIVGTERAELEPLRRWARVQLATTPDMSTLRLHPAGIAPMAESCAAWVSVILRPCWTDRRQRDDLERPAPSRRRHAGDVRHA